MSVVLLYITTKNHEEAARIADSLLEERLIACANLFSNMESRYWWKGKIESAQEAVLICKTDARNAELVTARILELHSYDTPCVLALPVHSGSADYLTWIEQESMAWDSGRAG